MVVNEELAQLIGTAILIANAKGWPIFGIDQSQRSEAHYLRTKLNGEPFIIRLALHKRVRGNFDISFSNVDDLAAWFQHQR